MLRRMAKVGFAGGVGEIRNSAGNVTYSRNRGGAYQRERVIPSNTITTARTNVRNALSAVSKAWAATLNEEERATWRAFAENHSGPSKLGQRSHLSGFDWFCRLNQYQQLSGRPFIVAPPAIPTVTRPTKFSVVTPGGAGAWTISNITPAPSVNEYLLIWGTQLLSVGRSNVNSFLRFITFTPTHPPSSFNIRANWIAKFGTPSTGMRVGIGITTISSRTGNHSNRLVVLSNT
jgi:hypothetical protein